MAQKNMPTAIYHNGRAFYYATGDGTIFEIDTGRPAFYRGVDRDVIYAYGGGPVFWIEVEKRSYEVDLSVAASILIERLWPAAGFATS
jgi:hypothetical protein